MEIDPICYFLFELQHGIGMEADLHIWISTWKYWGIMCRTDYVDAGLIEKDIVTNYS